MSVKCYVPNDPDTGKIYVNAVGSSRKECDANLSMIELSDDVLMRVEIVEATLTLNKEPTND